MPDRDYAVGAFTALISPTKGPLGHKRAPAMFGPGLSIVGPNA